MLNAEKYKEEIRRLNYGFALVNDKVVPCVGTFCSSCRFFLGCGKRKTEWLLSEYEPPKIESEVYSLKCDDRVEVSADGEHWFKQHFDRVEDELVYVWVSGKTSFTADDTSGWKYARIPREE